MSHFERMVFYGDEEFPDELLPAIDLRILASNAGSDSLNWGATPLNTYHDPVLSQRQEEVRQELERRARQVPPEVGDIPMEIQDYVAQNFLSRFNGRTMANFDNFSKRLHANPAEVEIADRMVLLKAIWGQATPAELLHVRCKFGMASIELGCISHPYGTHTDKLEEMQDSAREAMEMFGAIPKTRDELVDVFAVKRADNLSNSKRMSMHLRDAFLITRKRDYGTLPDGTEVRERTTLVVRIDPESEFDQKIAANMRKVPLIHNDDAMRHLAIAGKIEQTIPPLIKQKAFGTVIPLSTTMYAFNRLTHERIEARDRARRAGLLYYRALERERSDQESIQQAVSVTCESNARSLGGKLLRHLRTKPDR